MKRNKFAPTRKDAFFIRSISNPNLFLKPTGEDYYFSFGVVGAAVFTNSNANEVKKWSDKKHDIEIIHVSQVLEN